MGTSVAVKGNGGTAIAAYLSSQGVKVNLCDLFPQYIAGIQQANGVNLTVNGRTSHCQLNLVTTDIPLAIQDIHLIMVVTPSFTHRLIAEAKLVSMRWKRDRLLS